MDRARRGRNLSLSETDVVEKSMGRCRTKTVSGDGVMLRGRSRSSLSGIDLKTAPDCVVVDRPDESVHLETGNDASSHSSSSSKQELDQYLISLDSTGHSSGANSNRDTGIGSISLTNSDVYSFNSSSSSSSSKSDSMSISPTLTKPANDCDLITEYYFNNKFKLLNCGDESPFADVSSPDSNRRETIIFNSENNPAQHKDADVISIQTNLTATDVDVSVDAKPDAQANVESTVPAAATLGPRHARSKSNFSSCEVASLSSVYSNYSQFDFTQPNRTIPSPPPSTQPVLVEEHLACTKPQLTLSKSVQSTKSNTNGFSSFLGLFGNKKPTTETATSVNKSPAPNKFDMITSKIFNLKTSTTSPNEPPKVSTPKTPTESAADTTITTPISSTSSASLSSTPTELSSPSTENSSSSSIKSNQSINNLSYYLNFNPDMQVPNTVLIFENRPSNLPAKSQQEALKHKQEYEKMVEIAKKKELKEKEMKLKKYQQQIRKEDFMANSLKIWNTEILPNWNEQKNSKRTQQLWWHGLPPPIRGKVWKLAIGNELNLTHESYYFFEKKAKMKLELLSKCDEKEKDKSHESSVELIKLDVSRTFPHLCFFQKNGPYHEALHNVLGAYACYNTKIGYVQGMSFLTAILLLNMEAPDAFICLANLLNTKYLLACFCMDQKKMNRYFRVHQILLEYNIPKLYNHFEEQKVKPDLYLIDWIFTLFSKSLPLDVMSRVWDVFFRDKEEFLFRTALGILNLYKDTLLEADFIHIVKFLTKLPDNINSTQLFKSIEQINTDVDDSYFSFKNLINDCNY